MPYFGSMIEKHKYLKIMHSKVKYKEKIPWYFVDLLHDTANSMSPFLFGCFSQQGNKEGFKEKISCNKMLIIYKRYQCIFNNFCWSYMS